MRINALHQILQILIPENRVLQSFLDCHLSAFIKRSLHAKTIVFYYKACNFYENPISYYFIVTCIWQAQHSKREYFSVLSHDIFLYRRLCLYVHIQPGFERYVDAVIEYRDLLYQFPDKDVIYLITSRHPYTHTRLCGPVHHGL